MPQHRFLRNEDLAQVLTYIRQRFNNNADSVTAAQVKQGRIKTANQ